MDINTIYDKLILEGSVKLRGSGKDLDAIKSRLIQKKHRENKKLGEFAANSVVLKFNLTAPDFGDGGEMEVTLGSRGAALDVEFV